MTTNVTPLMKQYEEMKRKHPDAILLFRVGDFYEIFKDDAKAASEILGITLTSRTDGNSKKTYLAGFPAQALDNYLPKLIRAGKRAAICEQLEDPKLSPKTVKRGEPLPESKPKKQTKPKETKIYGNKDIEFDKLNPDNIIASFRVRIPKDCANMGKCVDKKGYHKTFNHVFVQPSTGKLLACDSRILAMADVECNGVWPDDGEKVEEGSYLVQKRFIAPISADAIAKYAGQEINVVTYNQDGNATTLITSETAVPTISSVLLKANLNYPNWERIWVKDCVEKVKLTEDAVKALRGWFKLNAPKKEWRVEINVSKQADNVYFTLNKENEYGEWEQVDNLYCDIESSYPQHDIHMTFPATLFQINTLDGFNGELWFNDLNKPIKFCGGQRESILMPLQGERDKFEK